MKNYYAEFLQKKNFGNIQGKAVSKVSKGLKADLKHTFDTFDTALPGTNQKTICVTERLNQMIAVGVSFEISADHFQSFGASERETVFLRENQKSVLCTLQQGFLSKHLFDHSRELLEVFQTQVHERSAIMTNGGAAVVFQAVAEVCADWIAEAIENTHGGNRKI